MDPLAETGPSESRTVSPAATGPSVFGIFEGRSPCQGIAREGRWTIVRGTRSDPAAIVYRLAPAGSEASLLLMKGDDHVLFFMDRNLQPLTAHADFSYTLNRRKPSA